MEQLVSTQNHGLFCTKICRTIDEGKKLSFKHDKNGLLVRTVHGDQQIVVRHSLKKRILYLNHYTVLTGNPGGRKLYHRIRPFIGLQALLDGAKASKNAQSAPKIVSIFAEIVESWRYFSPKHLLSRSESTYLENLLIIRVAITTSWLSLVSSKIR